MHPCEVAVPSSRAVCSGSPPAIGMSWKPMAAPVSPRAKRTKYFIVPESSMPVACMLRDHTWKVPGSRLSWMLPETR